MSSTSGEEHEPAPSKSERKRQATLLQKLGKRLTELKAEDLEQLALPEELLKAIADYQRFPSFEAKRRQLQFIGKLMRELDTDLVEEHLGRLDGTSAAARYEFHSLERWRERLLTEDDALTDFLDEHPHVDRQQLRLLIRRAREARDEQAQKTAARTLFRFLRDETQEA